MIVRRLAGIVMAVALCCGVALMLPAGTSAQSQVLADYQVGAGDLLKLSVYRAPEYETMLRVGGDGTVAIGGVGSLPVAGLTPSQVADLIAKRLKAAGIFNDPVVNVLVAEYHSKIVSVLGAVTRPGEYPIDRSGLTLSEVLARAGATLDNGTTRVQIVRQGDVAQPELLTLDDIVVGGRNRPVRPGDAIFVQLPPLVYVSGEVVRPGSFPMTPGMTVQQAITLAGDLGPRGSRSKIRVSHAGSAALKARPQDAVQPGDQVVVGARLF